MKIIVTYADYKKHFEGSVKENYNEETKTITVKVSKESLYSYLVGKGISHSSAIGVANFSIKAGVQVLKANIENQPESAEKEEILKAIEMIKEESAVVEEVKTVEEKTNENLKPVATIISEDGRPVILNVFSNNETGLFDVIGIIPSKYPKNRDEWELVAEKFNSSCEAEQSIKSMYDNGNWGIEYL